MTLICQTCEVEFPYPGHGPKSARCPACQRKKERTARREVEKAQVAARWADITCQDCSAPLQYGGRGRVPTRCESCKTAHNAEAAKKYAKEYYPRNKEKVAQQARESWLRTRYDLTVEQYDEMLAAQGGGCAICGEQCPSGSRLAVDHDHSTGTVRGLLCVRCNKGLGSFQDSIVRLRAAEQYLRAHVLQ